ncbi:hypothetical protein Tco_1008145 [Tanacetum coccineum]
MEKGSVETRDSKMFVWPEPTNGKEGRWSYDSGGLSVPFEGCIGEDGVVTCFLRMKFGLNSVDWISNGTETPNRVEVGDKVMLDSVSWKDEVHFRKKEMLAPRYVGPFEIH